MDQSHKIVVNFARSTTRKVDVHIDKLIDYEYTSNFKIYSNAAHTEGSVEPDVILETMVTLLLLILIAIVIKLVANG